MSLIFAGHLNVLPSAPCGNGGQKPSIVGANHADGCDRRNYGHKYPNRIYHAILLCISLTGCATPPTAAIPIPVSCVKEAPAKPATVSEAEILAMNDYAATLTTYTERLLLKAYADKAEAVISACR